MTDSSGSRGGRKRPCRTAEVRNGADDYRVGPGRPPKEFQFKPGQSGNPKGAKRKPRLIASDLKALLENALTGTVKLRQGTQEKVVTYAAAGIEQLVVQFAKGDRHARRDLFTLAEKLGVDLTAGQADALQQALAGALSESDQELLADYVRRHRDEGDFPTDKADVDASGEDIEHGDIKSNLRRSDR